MPKQYRRHDNHKKLFKGILWHIKNRGTLYTSTDGTITMEDIRDLKRQLDNFTNYPLKITNNA